MICGLGCDLCAIPRMEEILQDGRFLARYFSENERAYLCARTKTAQTAAGLFAAKEAFVKALGTGFAGISAQQVEIAHDGNGAPYYCINAAMHTAMEARGAVRAHLSISHDGSYAVATAILEGT